MFPSKEHVVHKYAVLNEFNSLGISCEQLAQWVISPSDLAQFN